MRSGELVFRPYFVQKGIGPHLESVVLTGDEENNVFCSDIHLAKEGVKISDIRGRKKFSIMLRWNVEGFGFLYLSADNGGHLYSLPNRGTRQLNLNYELLSSRSARNLRRLSSFLLHGWKPSSDLQIFLDLSMEYLLSAHHQYRHPEVCAQLAQRGLGYALWAGELMEIEFAKFAIRKTGYRRDFFFGCDARGYFQIKKNLFLDRFKELFNYATVTHYLIGDVYNFEPRENQKNYAERDKVIKALLQSGITVEGRPLFWTHKWVTPDWLRRKSYTRLLKYLEKHVRQVVAHYQDKITVWEAVNELHDWANELELSPQQTIEVTRLICNTARDTDPKIKLLINNCCPFAEYIQAGRWGWRKARYPQRTPQQFITDLIVEKVDFDIIGVQVYFVKRTIADMIENIERYRNFGKEIHLAEIGAPSRGTTQEFDSKDTTDFSTIPYEWIRHWDEELQADWLEYIFTLAYSRPYIGAANWYDFVDPYGYLKSGGLLRSPQGEKKAAFYRLHKIQKNWRLLKRTK